MLPSGIYVSPKPGPVHGAQNHLQILEYAAEQLQLFHLRNLTVCHRVLAALLFVASEIKNAPVREARADARRWEVFDDWGAGIDPAPGAVVS
jgi:hypothetical protein